MLGRGEVADEIGDEGHRVLIIVDGGHRLGLCVREGDLRVRPLKRGRFADVVLFVDDVEVFLRLAFRQLRDLQLFLGEFRVQSRRAEFLVQLLLVGDGGGAGVLELQNRQFDGVFLLAAREQGAGERGGAGGVPKHRKRGIVAGQNGAKVEVQ